MFCTIVKNKLKALLYGFDTIVDKRIDIALKITASLKSILASPTVDIITAIIPGNTDNIIRQQLVNILNKAVEALIIADNCRQHTDINDKLDCFIHQLQLHDPHLQDAVLLKLASLITSGLDGQRLKQNMYDLYTQVKYAATKKA